jgi:GGDEF domain-containing protein
VGVGGWAFITLAHEPESVGKRSLAALMLINIDRFKAINDFLGP